MDDQYIPTHDRSETTAPTASTIGALLTAASGSTTEDEDDLVRWGGDGGQNLDYDPSRWGRRL
jgi:hypothetical protein